MLYQAHRGVSTEYPENTMPAFVAAYEQGYPIIELDPLFTADGQCVVFHDRTICRTCRSPQGEVIEEPIRACDLSFDEIRALDAGLYMSEEFRGTKVPLLSEVLAYAEQVGLHVKLDNKFEHFTEEQKQTLFDIVAEAGADAGFTCAQPENIQLVVNRFPKATIHYDGYVDEKKVQAVKSLLAENPLTIWLALPSKLTGWLTIPTANPELCAMAKKYGKLGLWILETEDQLQQAVALGADVIETTGSLKP